MTEAAFGVYMITLALVCLSVYVCFRGIAWVVANGWRSMFGLVALRGEAVLTVDETDDIRANMSTGQWATEWDYDEVEAVARVVAAAEEQPNDFTLWESEFEERAS